MFFDDVGNFSQKDIFIQSDFKKYSYWDMKKISDHFGACLQPRSLVFSFCENSIGSVSGYLAFLHNRVVPVLLDKHIEKELRDRLIEIYQPDYLYMPKEMAGDFEELPILLEENGYCLLKTGHEFVERLHPDLALLLTTSGSTGSPKLVRQSYENIQSNAEQIARYLQIDETERPITTLPMNYTYGLSIINSHVLRGATILLTDHTLLQREFWKFFREEEATSFGGVPYHYEILKKLRFSGMDLPSLRYMTQAGGKLTPELHREFAEYAEEKGKKFVVMYGQCEATARMGYLPADMALEKCGSMGVAIPDGELILVDPDGKEITEPGTVGELVYRGPNVTLGYAECEADLAKGDERGGQLETGDMAKKDEEGFFYIVGRKKRFLKIFGNRVNLDETERMVKQFLPEIDCACGGVDDRLSVYITVDSEETKEMVRKFLAEKTGLHPSAFTVRYLSEIPKNESGKTLYDKLPKEE